MECQHDVAFCPFVVRLAFHILIRHLTGQNGNWTSLMFHLYGLVKVIKFQIEILVSSILQKTNAKFSLISAPPSKNWMNQKNKDTLLS